MFFTDGSEFSRHQQQLMDDTGTTWNVLGEATSGPRAGQRLEPVNHLDTFWFAWSGYHPDTAIIG